MKRLFYQNLTLAFAVIISANLSPSYAFKQSDSDQLWRTKQWEYVTFEGA
jgi:hypothetical protein